MTFNLIDLLVKARIVAWPLGLCSVLALAIVLERLFVLRWIRTREDQAFAADALKHLDARFGYTA